MSEHDAHDDAKQHSIIQPVSAPEGRATSDRVESDAETLGAGSGGFLGGVSGLALGAAAGPVGALLGALAGVAGGWWAGREVAHAFTDDDDRSYRSRYESAPDRFADRSYERMRPAYLIGHLAGRNPEYEGRGFDEVEGDLCRSWSEDVSARYGQWAAVRGYARTAFERARGTEPTGEE